MKLHVSSRIRFWNQKYINFATPTNKRYWKMDVSNVRKNKEGKQFITDTSAYQVKNNKEKRI